MRLVVFLFAGLLYASPAYAQIGFAAGLNYTALEDIDIQDARTTYENRTGFHVGAYLDLGFGPLNLRPGVYYLQSGDLFESGYVDFLQTYAGLNPEQATPFEDPNEVLELYDEINSLSLQYIIVPVDLRIGTATPVVSPYVFAGPEFRFRLNDIEAEVQDALDLRDFNVGANVGIGFDIGLVGYRLMPEIRYAFDISGITGDNFQVGGVSFEAEEPVTTRTLMLRVGVEF
ncbi:MAG: outer membrane beta-barrel protein [Bacteroidota bacterium]